MYVAFMQILYPVTKTRFLSEFCGAPVRRNLFLVKVHRATAAVIAAMWHDAPRTHQFISQHINGQSGGTKKKKTDTCKCKSKSGERSKVLAAFSQRD